MIKPQVVIVIALVGLLFSYPLRAQESLLNIEWLKVLDSEIDSLAISPDGNQIAFSTRENSTFAVIDWQSGETIWELHEDLGINVGVEAQAAWSPNSLYIARIVSDGSFAIYSASNGTHLEQVEAILINVQMVLTETSAGELSFFTDLEWNADGTQLAVMVRSYIIVFDLGQNTVQSVINPHVVPSSLQGQLSSFAWSPDGSRFAAYHFRIENGQEAFPPDIVIGFWDRNGRWLREYEENTQRDNAHNCIVNGEEIFRLHGLGLMGGQYEWSPNNATIGVIETTFNYESYSICTLNSESNLIVSEVGQFAPRHIHWNSNGEYLFAIGMDCSIYRTSGAGGGTTRRLFFDEPCHIRAVGCSQDDRYVVLGAEDGLWVGEIA